MMLRPYQQRTIEQLYAWLRCVCHSYKMDLLTQGERHAMCI